MRGFSYVELLVVITLIVVTALGGVFSLLKFNQSQGVVSAARSLAAVLRDANQRSIVQEEGMYWGVLFENLAGRDRYTLFKSANSTGAPYISANVFYLPQTISFSDPATLKTIIFDKINGNWISASCPSPTANTTLTINTFSVRVYCNGKIE